MENCCEENSLIRFFFVAKMYFESNIKLEHTLKISGSDMLYLALEYKQARLLHFISSFKQSSKSYVWPSP